MTALPAPMREKTEKSNLDITANAKKKTLFIPTNANRRRTITHTHTDINTHDMRITHTQKKILMMFDC